MSADSREARAPGARVRVGIDIGGTFTDFVLTGRDKARILIGKRLTSSEDPSAAVLAGLSELLQRVDCHPADLDVVIHATTLVTNTVIERTGACVGLITTQGFRDVLEIGNELRYDLYDLFMRMPEPLVPRYLRMGVSERTTANGGVLHPLDEVKAQQLVREMRAAGAEAIAVSLLHSYANSANEQAMRRAIETVDPQMPVTLSSELLPEIREYERTLASVINAYVQPKIRSYASRLSAGLRELGVRAPLYIMQSSGGLTTVMQAGRAPAALIESGPAAGAICAARVGNLSGLDRLISFDMGGTTAKTCLIRDGRPSISVDLEFARLERFKKGSGFAVRMPTVELIEIGAGGGSIAWIDEMSLLKVGPRSAGSLPGPACYGRGAVEPTVTDADLVLGYLDASHFLGGAMTLDAGRAADAIETRIAKPMGLTVIEAAWGIHQIVNENMALSSRIHVVERGEDPRSFTIVAFGGAGPVHAQAVAAKLGARRVLFPVAVGAASALGLLLAEPSADVVQTYLRRLEAADWNEVEALYSEMTQRAAATLADIVGDEWKVVRSIDLRYAGQGYELNVPLPDGMLSAHSAVAVAASFKASYERFFGRSMDRPILDIVNLRVVVRGETEPLSAHLTVDGGVPPGAPRPARKAWFGAEHGFLTSEVLDRYALKPGAGGRGPAFVEERESTIVVAPSQHWQVDENSNIVIELN